MELWRQVGSSLTLGFPALVPLLRPLQTQPTSTSHRSCLSPKKGLLWDPCPALGWEEGMESEQLEVQALSPVLVTTPTPALSRTFLGLPFPPPSSLGLRALAQEHPEPLPLPSCVTVGTTIKTLKASVSSSAKWVERSHLPGLWGTHGDNQGGRGFVSALRHEGPQWSLPPCERIWLPPRGLWVQVESGREVFPAECFKLRLWKCCSCHSATTQLGPTDSILISAQALFQTGC